MTRHEAERAYLLERCLRLEVENRVLRGVKSDREVWKTELIVALRGRNLTWSQIGAQLGISGTAAWKRYVKATKSDGHA